MLYGSCQSSIVSPQTIPLERKDCKLWYLFLLKCVQSHFIWSDSETSLSLAMKEMQKVSRVRSAWISDQISTLQHLPHTHIYPLICPKWDADIIIPVMRSTPVQRIPNTIPAPFPYLSRSQPVNTSWGYCLLDNRSGKPCQVEFTVTMNFTHLGISMLPQPQSLPRTSYYLQWV